MDSYVGWKLVEMAGWIKTVWKNSDEWYKVQLEVSQVLCTSGQSCLIFSLMTWIKDWTLSKFSDDTKVGQVANMPESCSTIQRDLNMLEKWAEDQQREIQSPAFEEEQLHALVVHAGDRAAVK